MIFLNLGPNIHTLIYTGETPGLSHPRKKWSGTSTYDWFFWGRIFEVIFPISLFVNWFRAMRFEMFEILQLGRL